MKCNEALIVSGYLCVCGIKSRVLIFLNMLRKSNVNVTDAGYRLERREVQSTTNGFQKLYWRRRICGL